MQTKCCKKCKIVKSVSEYDVDYHKNADFYLICKSCLQLRRINKILRKQNKQICSKCLIEKDLDTNFYKKEGKRYTSICKKCYAYTSNDKFLQKKKERRKNNPSIRIVHNLRTRIINALKGKSKSKSTIELLGCSPDFFKSYIESLFLPEMSWDNYGVYGWHIDHIKPCFTFDLTISEQQKECFHYSNLRPLWAKDNLTRPKPIKNKKKYIKMTKWKDVTFKVQQSLNDRDDFYLEAFNEFSQSIAIGKDTNIGEDQHIELEGLKFKADTNGKIWLDFDSLKEFLNK